VDRAYSSMDYEGVGIIPREAFLKSMACAKSGFTSDELVDFVMLLFPEAGLTFDSFKKTFFPHLYLINDDAEESDEERRDHKEKRELLKNQEKQPEIIVDRLKKLERLLKERFSNNWDSVRKAFLGLDSDYDGYITVEDILRHFGNQGQAGSENNFNFNDLKKILIEKDSSRRGKLGYADFSKWVGNSIHQSEGFYFRHDSVRNPDYEGAKAKRERSFGQTGVNTSTTPVATKETLDVSALEKTIIDKIKF